jgi:hypothetical protein
MQWFRKNELVQCNFAKKKTFRKNLTKNIQVFTVGSCTIRVLLPENVREKCKSTILWI